MTEEQVHQLMKQDGWIDGLGYAIRSGHLYALGGLSNEIEASLQKHKIQFERTGYRYYKLTNLNQS